MMLAAIYILGAIITFVLFYRDSMANGLQSGMLIRETKYVGNRRVATLSSIPLALIWPLMAALFTVLWICVTIGEWAKKGDPS